MKKDISSLELYYLVKELKSLENSKVDKIYHSKEQKDELVIALHLSGEGKKYLRAIIPAKIFVQDSKEEQGTPTGLCMMLRKYLEGSILRKISQKGFERVIFMEFESRYDGKISTFIIIIELFSKGNIIFCDDKYKILNLFEEQHWKDREIKKDEIYQFPKSRYDIFEVSEKQFEKIINDSGKDSVVKALAIELSLGGVYAEELCLVSGIDKNEKTKDINREEFLLLYKNFTKLFEKDIDANLSSSNILPFKLKLFSNVEKNYESFNRAIIENLDIKQDKGTLEKEKLIEKLQAIINEQVSSLDECQKNYDEQQSKAEMIYSRYQEIDDILKVFRKAREKYSWKEIKERISKDPKFKDKIKNINEKDHEVTIEM